MMFLRVLLCIFPLLAFSLEKSALIYNKTTGTNTVTMTFTIEKQKEQYLIQGISKTQTIDISASIPYVLCTYSSVSNKNKDFFNLKLVNGVLKAEGEKGGEKLAAEYKITTPWIQDFEFGFKTFIQSNVKSLNYCVVNPSTLKLYEMVATKEEEEALQVGEKEYKALRVKVTLAGLKKMFWKGLIWYEKETGLMLKYEANEGPHTPTSTTALASVDKAFMNAFFSSSN